MGPAEQSELGPPPLIKGAKGGSRERVQDGWPALAPPLQLTVLPLIYIITHSCWRGRKVTLTPPPPRPGPSPSPSPVARRRSGGREEGGRGC